MITSTGMLPEKYTHITGTTRMEIAGIPAAVIPVPYSNHMSFPQRTKAFIRFALLASREAMRNKADVIFATSAPLTIAIPGIIGKLWQRKPLVFEARDLWPEMPIQLGVLKNPALKAAAVLLEWVAYHASDHLVALSPGIRAGIERTGIPAGRISLIYNCADLDLFDIPASRGDAIRARLGLISDQPLVLYAGTFGILNRVEYLVSVAAETLKTAPNVHYLLIGSGKQFEHVQQRARELGLLDKTVHVWNPLPKVEMPEVFAAATVSTVLFQPIDSMWRTNSANKFFDALAARKPVVLNYEQGWQADILWESGAGITLPPMDTTAAAAKLVALLNDPVRMQAAQTAAHGLAINNFNRDLMAEKLEQVLKQAAGFQPALS